MATAWQLQGNCMAAQARPSETQKPFNSAHMEPRRRQNGAQIAPRWRPHGSTMAPEAMACANRRFAQAIASGAIVWGGRGG